VKAVTLVAPLIVIGLFTRHEPSLVILGGVFILVLDLMVPPGPRTRFMLSVSVIYTATFAIGMLISMVDYLVAPLLALGFFFIAYLKVYPRAFIVIIYVGVFFLIGIINQNSTLTATGIGSLDVLIGGLWALLLTAIFPSRKFFKRQTTDQSVQEHHQQQQEQSRGKLTWQDKFKPFTSNLSIHSNNFQYALAFSITSVIGLLITQWFKLPESGWVLATIFAILVPFADVYLDFNRGVHRIIDTLLVV
jgi:membrane protein implicated in regulation of membrane protease activity